MKRFAFALLSIVTLCLSTGCCGFLTPCGYRGGYGPAYGGGCATGNCGVPQGGQIIGPQSNQFEGPGTFQNVGMGVEHPYNGSITGMPIGQSMTTIAPDQYPLAPVPHMAARPLESLPTY